MTHDDELRLVLRAAGVSDDVSVSIFSGNVSVVSVRYDDDGHRTVKDIFDEEFEQ